MKSPNCECPCAPDEHGKNGCKTWYGDRNTGFECGCTATCFVVNKSPMDMGTVTEADLRGRRTLHLVSNREWRLHPKNYVPKETKPNEIPDFAIDLTTCRVQQFAWCDMCHELSDGSYISSHHGTERHIYCGKCYRERKQEGASTGS